MAFSIAGSPGISTIMAEIVLNEGQPANETEGLILPQEWVDPETFPQGALRGETKQYTCTPQERSSLPEKLHLSDVNPSQKKEILDQKNGSLLSLKENLFKEKEFKVLNPHKHNLEEKPKEERCEEKTFTKLDKAAKETFEKAATPKSSAQPKETPLLKQQQTQAKTLERRLQKEFIEKDQTTRPSTPSHRKTAETRKEGIESEQKQEISQPEMQRSHKNEERGDPQQRRQKREEEEGFAEGQRDQGQQSSDEGEEQRVKTERTDRPFAQEFARYGAEESILSEIFKMRVSQFDVLILFIEIMKIELRSREQEKIARRQERELQLIHMQNIVDNYKSMGNMAFMTGLGSGVMAIISGFCPIVGHMKGDWIKEKLGGFFESIRNMETDKLVKSATKITYSMSEMQKTTGQIHNTYAEGHKTFDQHMSDLHKTDWDENTRTMEEIKDSWKGIENFLYQSLQMYHDAIRQLYS